MKPYTIDYIVIAAIGLLAQSMVLAADCNFAAKKQISNQEQIYPSIQAAIDQAGPGTTIFIGKNVDPTTHLSIQGKSELIVMSTCDAVVNSIEVASSKNITLSGLIIKPSNLASAIHLKGNNDASEDVYLVNNKILGSSQSTKGIEVHKDNKNIFIAANLIQNFNEDGIQIKKDVDAKILENFVTKNSGNGISIAGDAIVELDANRVTENNLSGIFLQGSLTASLRENFVSRNISYGLSIHTQQDSSKLFLVKNQFVLNSGAEEAFSSRDIKRYNLITNSEHSTYTSAGVEGAGFMDGSKEGIRTFLDERVKIEVGKDSLPQGYSVDSITVTEKPKSQIPSSTIPQSRILGLPMEFLPGGVFNTPLIVKIHISAAEAAKFSSGFQIELSHYDPVTQKLNRIPSVYDPETEILTAQISHFTTYVAVANEVVIPPPFAQLPKNGAPNGFPWNISNHPYYQHIPTSCSMHMNVPNEILMLPANKWATFPDRLVASWPNWLQNLLGNLVRNAPGEIFSVVWGGVTAANISEKCFQFQRCVLEGTSLNECHNNFNTDLQKVCLNTAFHALPLEKFLKNFIAQTNDPNARKLLEQALKLAKLVYTGIQIENPLAYEAWATCAVTAPAYSLVVQTKNNQWEAWQRQQDNYEQDFTTMISPPTCHLTSQTSQEAYFDETVRVQINVTPVVPYDLFAVIKNDGGWHALNKDNFEAILPPRSDNYEIRFRNIATDQEASCLIAVSEKPIQTRYAITGIYPTFDGCADSFERYEFNLNADTDGDDIFLCIRKQDTFVHVVDINFTFDNCPNGYMKDETDLNQGAGGAFVHMCTRVADTRNAPILPVRDIYLYETDHVNDECLPGYQWIPVDLNEGARKRRCTIRGCGNIDTRNIYMCVQK